MKAIERLKSAITAMLRKGTAPEQIATALTLGAVLGTFPVLGLSTLLCVLAATALHLNQGLIQAANYAVYPLQIMSATGSLALAAWLSGLSPADSAVANEVIRSDPWQMLSTFKGLIGYAVMIWLATTPLLFALLHWLTRRIVLKISVPVTGRNS
jgi:hypothetical protein